MAYTSCIILYVLILLIFLYCTTAKKITVQCIMYNIEWTRHCYQAGCWCCYSNNYYRAMAKAILTQLLLMEGSVFFSLLWLKALMAPNRMLWPGSGSRYVSYSSGWLAQLVSPNTLQNLVSSLLLWLTLCLHCAWPPWVGNTSIGLRPTQSRQRAWSEHVTGGKQSES